MDSLANYGSDDEYEDTNSEKMGTSDSSGTRTQPPEADANYEEVQMDLSEESNNNTAEDEQKVEKRKSRSPDPRSSRDSRKRRDRSEDKTRSDDKLRSDDKRRDDDRRRDTRDRDDRHDRRRDDRTTKRDEKRRRRSSSKDRRRSNSRERRRSNSRERKRSNSRERRRSNSRERRRSRSPRRDERRRRSSSKERRYGKRFDRTSNKIAQLEKLGIELPGEITPQTLLQRSMAEQVQKVKHSTGIELPKYYNPAAMNPARYADQIQKRRLLWQKKDETTTEAKPTTGKVWEATTFAQDSDGKVASKFKRLMGIKDTPGSSKDGAKDILKKQEEMFSSMEQQYEVARTATHTMRGVGLGFGSFNYSR